MNIKKFKTTLGGKDLLVETGKLANQANGSVIVQYGETVVLATAVMSKNQHEGVDYFPLSVDFEEKLYAAGKIKGSRWIKREGRPSDEAILSGRMIDRTLRPLFNQDMRNDVQIIITVFSIDEENDPDIPALLAASLALGISDIPWNGPVSAVRIGKDKDDFVINPNYQIREQGGLDLIVAGKYDKINMLEGGSQEIAEAYFLQAIAKAEKPLQKLIKWQEKIIKEIGKPKQKINLPEKELIPSKLEKKFVKFWQEQSKDKLIEQIKNDWQKEFTPAQQQILNDKFTAKIKQLMKKQILENNQRADGRKPDEIRPLSAEVGCFPRTHGSGLFVRGKTQVVSIVTLGAPGDEQFLETMETETRKRFIYHYNFPPYAPGETAPLRSPSRREIGHGALAEKAICALMPKAEDFPYTTRVVSEVLSSNGSTSMASACSASLALMDAGVPLKKPVAGIALGLVGNVLLTDIQGPEDHWGEMDLKLVGTKDGLTAWQMDVKNQGIGLDLLKKAVEQSRKARLQILQTMNKAIKTPRPKLSPYAPRVHSMKINPEKIRDVIGPGGKTINKIIEKTDVDIDIEDDGLVMITSKNAQSAQKAIKIIKNLTKEIKPGEIFTGKINKIMDFGAFVKLTPNQDGLIHISDLSKGYVKNIKDVVNIGQEVKVKVKEVDDQGRVNLILINDLKK